MGPKSKSLTIMQSIDEYRSKRDKAQSNVDRLRAERVAVYREVQDFTVSANKTDDAVRRMKNIDEMIRKEEKAVRDFNAKIKRQEEISTPRAMFSRSQKFDDNELSDN